MKLREVDGVMGGSLGSFCSQGVRASSQGASPDLGYAYT